MTAAVCELGPVMVRRLSCATAEPVHIALAAAVLDSDDDPVVLASDQPIGLTEAWCTLLEPLLHPREPALLVHPSWWPVTRIDNIRRVAEQFCGELATTTRIELLAEIADPATIVEIGPRLIVISAPDAVAPTILIRSAAPEETADSIAHVLARGERQTPVWIDGPAGVPGASALTVLIGARLRVVGGSVRSVGDRELRTAADRAATPDTAVSREWLTPRRFRMLIAAATTITAVIVAATWIDRPAAYGPTTTTALIEGRVTMQIPADWSVRRISSGPGSARVEVVSPTNTQVALHLTQTTSVPADSLAVAAATLRRAIDAEPAGVFVDFNPADTRAGRNAITYREIRSGHEIQWAVFLDGGIRIGIGCQYGTDVPMTAACTTAITSAHRIR
jgi:type VII secretion-associated protein (TIGR03931 family)